MGNAINFYGRERGRGKGRDREETPLPVDSRIGKHSEEYGQTGALLLSVPEAAHVTCCLFQT